MSKINDTINIKGFSIQFYTNDFKNDYISLTNIAKYKSDDPNYAVKNWMRRKDTIEFLGLWECLNKIKLDIILFHYLRRNGLKRQMQLELYLK